MGIWDSIKKAKNYLTGGGANIEIEIIGTPHLKKAFTVRIDVEIEKSDIQADRIYIIVQNTEHVEMNIRSRNTTGRNRGRTHRRQNVLFKEDIVLEEMVLLTANDHFTYKADILLPEEANPSYTGVNAKVSWSLQACIEKSGNNPESERIYFDPFYTIS